LSALLVEASGRFDHNEDSVALFEFHVLDVMTEASVPAFVFHDDLGNDRAVDASAEYFRTEPRELRRFPGRMQHKRINRRADEKSPQFPGSMKHI